MFRMLNKGIQSIERLESEIMNSCLKEHVEIRQISKDCKEIRIKRMDGWSSPQHRKRNEIICDINNGLYPGLIISDDFNRNCLFDLKIKIVGTIISCSSNCRQLNHPICNSIDQKKGEEKYHLDRSGIAED